MTIGVNGQRSELSRAGLALSIPTGPEPPEAFGFACSRFAEMFHGRLQRMNKQRYQKPKYKAEKQKHQGNDGKSWNPNHVPVLDLNVRIINDGSVNAKLIRETVIARMSPAQFSLVR
jgi:hypothetical protein